MSVIDVPTARDPQHVTGNWTVLPSWLPVPGLGALAVNSFLHKGSEPMLVDTGLSALGETFLAALEQQIDPGDLRWIWVSHMDADHVGNLQRVLDRAPRARIVTNFLGMGKMGMMGFDTSRVHLLEPGQGFEAGGKRFHPVRPPYYDAPETIGFFDAEDRVFFAADSFGALLPEPVHEIDEAADEALKDGLVAWSSIDAPWLANADANRLGRTLKAIEDLDPEFLFSGHLPLARRGVSALTGHVAGAYCRGTDAAIDPLTIEYVAQTLG